MKQYLLVDLMSDYKELKDYEGLRQLLINYVVGSIHENIGMEDILVNDIKILEKLAREKAPTLDYIKEELLGYSYKVIDLLDLQRDLEDMKQYFKETSKEFDVVLDKINKEVNNNGN